MKLIQCNQEYFKLLSEKLEQSYCINFNDTGYTETKWLERFGDLQLDQAVAAYAQKYDLTSVLEIMPRKNIL
jgi:hypothetical protein